MNHQSHSQNIDPGGTIVSSQLFATTAFFAVVAAMTYLISPFVIQQGGNITAAALISFGITRLLTKFARLGHVINEMPNALGTRMGFDELEF